MLGLSLEIILIVFLLLLIILLAFVINKRFSKLEMEIINLKRQYNQKINLVNDMINSLTSDLPLEFHPSEREKKIFTQLQTSLKNFSTDIQKNVQKLLSEEHSEWDDKFSALLHLTGKTKEDIKAEKNNFFVEDWKSISKVRQQSIMLFNDMKEDGTFFRMYSLWTLSNLSISQQKHEEAWRHMIAAIKLYCDSKPELPLTHRLAWNIAQSLYQSSLNIDKRYQIDILEKFNITAEEIVSYLSSINNSPENTETIQLLMVWESQLSNFK
ncbi:MAG: hypothetical protein ACRCS8_06000 [Brevinema sp.]